MMHFKKGMLVLTQDEQTSSQQDSKRVQRHVALNEENNNKEQNKRARRFVRGMMVMVPQKDGELV